MIFYTSKIFFSFGDCCYVLWILHFGSTLIVEDVWGTCMYGMSGEIWSWV
jgi:hypothetical protein